MSNIDGINCLNHTNTPAAARCTTCMKPVCHECITVVNQDSFCSQNCAENHIRTSAEIARFKNKQKSGGMKKVIMLAIIAALIWFGWTKKDDLQKIFNEEKEQLKN
ncbi:MAG: hypothetical protein NE328_03180 [Lentisphaeraceae bacterium]|nr:hypothetical protein [Lentisphaeraceae bacterium]